MLEGSSWRIRRIGEACTVLLTGTVVALGYTCFQFSTDWLGRWASQGSTDKKLWLHSKDKDRLTRRKLSNSHRYQPKTQSGIDLKIDEVNLKRDGCPPLAHPQPHIPQPAFWTLKVFLALCYYFCRSSETRGQSENLVTVKMFKRNGGLKNETNSRLRFVSSNRRKKI